MALRALVYSKLPLTASALAPVFKGIGIEADVCGDAFSAIEKATRQAFSCVIVDWADQPEAGFLLKRARESASNRSAVAIAIVEHEPAPVEIRENRLDFLLYRPITVGEAAAVLAKACQQMQVQSAVLETEPEMQGPLEHFPGDEAADRPEDPNLVSVTAAVPKPTQGTELEEETADETPAKDDFAEDPYGEMFAPQRTRHAFSFRAACAVILALAAVFCLWRARDTIHYLSYTREGVFHVLRESVAALFFTNKSGAQPVGSAVVDSQQDAYFVRPGDSTDARSNLGVVSTEANVPEAAVRLPKAFDFPLPAPEFNPPELPPIHVGRVPVPESLRGSLPIGPPVVATGAAQIMPASVPVPPLPQQFNEPVRLSEEAARAMLVHTVDPAYPREAAAQNLQGPVVLDALIGRDGSVEDLKIVRGYFVLGRAAIAAVKQWRFQPYLVNGRAAQTQTTLTINFGR